MENLEDVLKIGKKLVTTKRGSCDQFLAKIKFSEPGKAENVSRVLVLVAGLFTFQVLDVSRDLNSRNMVRNKAEISTHKQLKWRSLCAPLDIVPLLPLSFFSIFGMLLFFWDSLTFSFYFLIFFLHLGSQKK